MRRTKLGGNGVASHYFFPSRSLCPRGAATAFRQPAIKLGVLDLPLTSRAVPVCGEPPVAPRVLNLSLACRSLPVYRKPPVLFGVLHFSLAGWTLAVPGEAPIAFFILDASLPRRSLPVFGQTSVPRRVLNASPASRSRFGTGAAGCFNRLFAHCSHKSDGKASRGVIFSQLHAFGIRAESKAVIASASPLKSAKRAQ